MLISLSNIKRPKPDMYTWYEYKGNRSTLLEAATGRVIQKGTQFGVFLTPRGLYRVAFPDVVSRPFTVDKRAITTLIKPDRSKQIALKSVKGIGVRTQAAKNAGGRETKTMAHDSPRWQPRGVTKQLTAKQERDTVGINCKHYQWRTITSRKKIVLKITSTAKKDPIELNYGDIVGIRWIRASKGGILVNTDGMRRALPVPTPTNGIKIDAHKIVEENSKVLPASSWPQHIIPPEQVKLANKTSNEKAMEEKRAHTQQKREQAAAKRRKERERREKERKEQEEARKVVEEFERSKDERAAQEKERRKKEVEDSRLDVDKYVRDGVTTDNKQDFDYDMELEDILDLDDFEEAEIELDRQKTHLEERDEEYTPEEELNSSFMDDLDQLVESQQQNTTEEIESELNAVDAGDEPEGGEDDESGEDAGDEAGDQVDEDSDGENPDAEGEEDSADADGEDGEESEDTGDGEEAVEDLGGEDDEDQPDESEDDNLEDPDGDDLDGVEEEDEDEYEDDLSDEDIESMMQAAIDEDDDDEQQPEDLGDDDQPDESDDGEEPEDLGDDDQPDESEDGEEPEDLGDDDQPDESEDGEEPDESEEEEEPQPDDEYSELDDWEEEGEEEQEEEPEDDGFADITDDLDSVLGGLEDMEEEANQSESEEDDGEDYDDMEEDDSSSEFMDTDFSDYYGDDDEELTEEEQEHEDNLDEADNAIFDDDGEGGDEDLDALDKEMSDAQSEFDDALDLEDKEHGASADIGEGDVLNFNDDEENRKFAVLEVKDARTGNTKIYKLFDLAEEDSPKFYHTVRVSPKQQEAFAKQVEVVERLTGTRYNEIMMLAEDLDRSSEKLI